MSVAAWSTDKHLIPIMKQVTFTSKNKEDKPQIKAKLKLYNAIHPGTRRDKLKKNHTLLSQSQQI